MTFKIKIPKKLNYEQIIVWLFSILPAIDTLNGYLSSNIGMTYKMLVCVVLLLAMVRNGAIRRNFVTESVIVFVYIAFTIFFNSFVFSGKIIEINYPIKLFFNFIMFFLLMENYRVNNLNGYSFFKMLDNSAWMMVFCFLIPYFLKVGSSVYGNVGYKAFFYSQNELSLVLIVLSFFCAYKMVLNPKILSFVEYGLIMVCAILLNTKSTLLICLVSFGAFLLTVAHRGGLKQKIFIGIGLIIGVLLLKNKFISAVQASMGRYDVLKNKYYGGSILTSILSQRDLFALSAWKELTAKHTLFRFFFGNGFCSTILTEMDFVDIFFYLGVIGLIAVTIFFMMILKYSIPNFKTDRTCIRALSFWAILGFIMFTGHVIFMAMSGCYAIVYYCFLITFRNENINTRKNACEQV